MKPEDFMLEDTPEAIERKALKKRQEDVKQVTMGFLAKAVSFYKRAARGETSPTLIGKSIAYLSAFQEMAPVLGIKKELYSKIITQLYQDLGKLSIKIQEDAKKVIEDAKKTIIEHRGDPALIALEEKKLAFREKTQEIKIEDNRPPAPGALKDVAFEQPTDEGVIKEVIDWLVHSQLGYDKQEAEKRARRVYQPGVPVAELVAAACRS